jgi:hypothetical protein
MSFRPFSTLALLAVSVMAAGVDASPFGLTVNGTTDNISTRANSLPDLVDNLINAQGQFRAFDGQAFNANLTYGGVRNAMNFNANAAGTSATLTIPSTGFQRTFTGANRAEVQDQIEDFLLTDGLKAYGQFLQIINENSLLGIVDGNPRATTALMSDHAFYNFGLGRSPIQRLENPTAGAIASPLRFDFEGGVSDNDEADETFFSGALSTGIIGENLGVTFATIVNFRDLENAELFSVGFELGVPFFIIKPKDAERTLSWQVTPVGSVSGGASYDLAAGGTQWGLGVTSALSYRMGNLIFTLANQITHYEGFSIEIGNYEFDTLVDQDVLKNGVGVQYLTGWGFIDASISYTNFLQDAAVEQYWSPAVGVGFTWGEASGFRVGYKGDFDSDYTAHALEAMLYFGF